MTTLRATIPDDLHDAVVAQADREHITVDALISRTLRAAVALPLLGLSVENRAARGNWQDFDRIMEGVPDAPPVPGDERTGFQPKPKVFLSYSWTNRQYQDQVMTLANRLMEEGGVEVIFDEYDLKVGQDKIAFMERLINDKSLNHCVIFSDAAYTRKANERKDGVGTEVQIISQAVYDSIEQTKFVPVVMELTEGGKPCLPTFLQNRKYIDFSSPEKLNENWETFVRLLYGASPTVKPKIGRPPAFLDRKTEVPRLRNESRESALPAEERLERAIRKLATAKTAKEEFYALNKAAKLSFNLGEIDQARRYAEDLMKRIPLYEGDWNYGNAIQDANLVLGRIAVREERIDDAKWFLIQAGKGPGSPQLNSFGPNMSLAEDLLRKEERDTVLEYFELCRRFWRMDRGRIEKWSGIVRSGKIPDFGPNLNY